MNNIPEDILLLGLIVKTKPFEYSNSIVSCNYEKYVEIENLENLKNTIQNSFDNLPDDQKTDEISRQYSDDLYFLNYVIETLKGS